MLEQKLKLEIDAKYLPLIKKDEKVIRAYLGEKKRDT